MPVVEKLKTVRKRLLSLVEKLAPLGPLMARLTVGIVFMQTGWGKLHNLSQVTAFFTELHIPAPAFQAALVATTELVGGVCLILGLLTRLAALPLACTMVVAILTAKLADVDGLGALLGLNEFLYLMVFLWLAIAGPGKLSIDRLIAKRLDGAAPAV